MNVFPDIVHRLIMRRIQLLPLQSRFLFLILVLIQRTDIPGGANTQRNRSYQVIMGRNDLPRRVDIIHPAGRGYRRIPFVVDLFDIYIRQLRLITQILQLPAIDLLRTLPGSSSQVVGLPIRSRSTVGAPASAERSPGLDAE